MPDPLDPILGDPLIPEEIPAPVEEDGTNRPSLDRLKESMDTLRRPLSKKESSAERPTHEQLGGTPSAGTPPSRRPKVSGEMDRIKNLPGSREMGREYTAPPGARGTSTPSGGERLTGKALSQFNAGREKYNQARAQAGEIGDKLNAARDIKDHADEYAKETARQAAKRAGKAAAQATKRFAAQAGRAVATFLADNPIVWLIIGIILVIFIIIAIVIAIFAFSRGNGGGPASLPSTQVEKSQAGLLAAFAGDKLKQFKIVEQVVQSEEKRYQTIDTLIKTNPGNGTISASAADVQKVEGQFKQLESLIKAQDKTNTILTLKQVISLEKTVEHGLPFGTWIATIAKQSEGQQTKCYTVYTGAASRVGCASVVSVILNQAGVPQPPVGSTLEVWQNPVYSIVVPRPAALDRTLAKNSLATLQPGDIVWWGNGAAASYPGALFDHIGIYIGNDKTVNNSSSKEIVRETPLDRSDKVFNGAKRYAP